MPANCKPIIPLLPYQRADVMSAARFRWNCWSRQSGKSFTKSLRRILRGLKRRRNQIFLSAGERQSRELMLKARQHCQALQIATEFYKGRDFEGTTYHQMEIVLPRGVRIIALPANPHTARGYTGDVFLDEFAMHVDDREIWAAMFPALLRGNGELDVASTPRGKSNLFYQLQFNAMFEQSRITLPDAIAQGLEADESEMRRAMGDAMLFRQEFLCEFLDEATAFLTYDQIAACTDAALHPFTTVAPLLFEARDLYVGVDIGRRHDLTVVWVLGESAATAPHQACRALDTVALFELSNAPFRQQQALLTELLALPRVRRCCVDAGGLGMQLAEQLVERFGGHRVEGITFTPAIKSHLAGALRIAVENRSLRIPDDERIRNDFHSVERVITEAGHFRLAAPRTEGAHADRFWAAALALHAAEAAPSRILEAHGGRELHYARTGIW